MTRSGSLKKKAHQAVRIRRAQPKDVYSVANAIIVGIRASTMKT